MNDKVFVSIGIPFYNAEEHLSNAIKSVIGQTHSYWELILIDDGSSDNSLAIANEFSRKDNRIRVISDGRNEKLPARLNQMIKEAKYDYFARMDADDLMHPQRLEKQLKFLINNPDFDVVSTGLISIDSKNNVKGFRAVNKKTVDLNPMNGQYPIVHPSIMARKTWYIRNNYSEKYPRAEDYELWTRTLKANDLKIMILPELLLFYREEGSLSKDKILKSYKDIINIQLDYFKGDNYSVIFKYKLKSYIVIILAAVGGLQLLAKSRNKIFANTELIDFQNILNNIVSSEI